MGLGSRVKEVPGVEQEFRGPLELALELGLEYLKGLETKPVSPTADLATLRRQLVKPLNAGCMDAERVVAELARDVEGGLVASAGGRFYAWVMGGSVPAALAADWLTSAWDQNAALYACSPAAAVAEEVAGVWLKDLLELPAQASFALTTGCQTAHITCLAAARHAVLARAGWDVEEQGMSGAPFVRVLCSAEQHGSVARAVRLLGFGARQVTAVDVDDRSRIVPEALEEALNKCGGGPVIVVLQAGDINTGEFDLFEQVIPMAKRYGAWVHLDGAFGLWAAASREHKYLMTGAELADSWATDGHKWLNVPYDCGYAFVADREAHHGALTYHASYVTHNADARDEMDWNVEWSRRGRGFATYAALRQLGREGVADLVDRCCEHAHSIVMRLGALPGAEVLWEPMLNQGMVRFRSAKAGATEADHDARTEEVIAAILATGEAFFSGTTWRGKRAMRVSVCNWQTSVRDVDRVVACVGKAVQTKTPSA